MRYGEYDRDPYVLPRAAQHLIRIDIERPLDVGNLVAMFSSAGVDFGYCAWLHGRKFLYAEGGEFCPRR